MPPLFLASVSLSSFRFVLFWSVLCTLACLAVSGHAAVNPLPVTVVSAASFETAPVAPDSVVSAFGTKMATATISATDLDPNLPGIQLPEQLAGTSVRVNGQLAKLLFVSERQVNFIMPAVAVKEINSIQIISGDGTESYGTVEVINIFPSIFTANEDGQGVLVATVVRVRNGVRLPDESLTQFDSTTKRYLSKPLDLGPASDRVFLEIYCTGIRGAGDPNNDGNLQENVWVLLGGQIITPTYAGRQANFAGLDQVNFEIPRDLIGSGKLNLSIHVRRKIPSQLYYEGYTAKLVEFAIADTQGTNPPTVSDFSPTNVLAGQTITITGQGFSLIPEDNVVKIGSAIASVEFASATRLVARVPFGSASDKVTVKTPNGVGASAGKLAIRTSISGYVELIDGAIYPQLGPRSPSLYTLKNIAVRLVGTNISTRTNEEGVFQLTDVPLGVSYLEIDANITLASQQFPKLKVQVPVTAGKDNLLDNPIWLQASNGPNITLFDINANSNLRTDIRVELGDGTAIQYADGTTNRNIAVTRIWQLPQAAPDTPQPSSVLGILSLLQVTPFEATFTAGAKLVIPEVAGVPLSQFTKVYRYDLTVGSATFGRYVEVEGVTFNIAQLIHTLEVPIKETGYYLVGFAPPSAATISIDPTSPARIGVVKGTDGKTPVNNALVSEGLFPGQWQRTDGSGTYIIRNTFFNGVLVRFLSPDGKVVRRYDEPVSYEDTQLSIPAKMNTTGRVNIFTKSGIVLLPDTIKMNVNEQRYENFLLLQEKGIQQVSVTGAPFASILRSGEGLYTLILKPKTRDFGSFRLSVLATDDQGQSYFRFVDVLISAPNKPPVITVPQDEYRMKVGETLSVPVTASDPDTDQNVSLFLDGVGILAGPGNPARATYTFTPTPTTVGTFSVTFSATDDGFGALRTTKAIRIRVEATAKSNEWTLISYDGLIGLLTDTTLYGEPVALDTPGSSLNFIGGILYRSVFGEGVSFSTDRGITWTNAVGLNIKTNFEYVGQVVGSEKLLMVEVGSTTYNRIYASTNGGKDWVLFMNYSEGQNVLAGDNRGNLLVRGNDGQLYKAVLDGASIKLTLTNLPNGNFKLVAASGTKLYAAIDRSDVLEDKIYQSTDSGVNWIDVTTKFPVGDYRTIHIAGKRIYVRTSGGVFVSTDEGVNWSALVRLPNTTTALYFASNGKYVFSLFSDGRVYAFPLL